MKGNKPFQPLVFTVGENPTDFIQRMKNIRQPIGVDRQPAGLNFYTIDAPQGTRKIARIEHGPYSFEIPPVIGFMGVESMRLPELGIKLLDFTFVRKDDGQKTLINKPVNFLLAI